MARNYKELQAKMNTADVAENRQRVREELQRMALGELRNTEQLTQHSIHATGQMVGLRESDEGPASRGTPDFNDTH